MNYLQSLLALDGVAISNYELALSAENRQRETPGLVKLLLALNAEAETAATLVAVSASIANALESSEEASPRPSARSLVTFAPPELVLLAASTSQLVSAQLDGNMLVQMQNFSNRLTLAKQLSRAYAAEQGIRSQKTSIDIAALGDAWRHACRSAIGALRSLKSELKFQGAEAEAPAKVGLPDLLEVAARGLSPCVEPDGCVIVPGWAERRRHKRRKLDLAAEASVGSRVQPVQIFDVSAGGMGVSGLNLGQRGDLVSVKLPCGRRLRATLAWIAGNRAGLRFQTPLSSRDPLLCE